jgi:integrase
VARQKTLTPGSFESYRRVCQSLVTHLGGKQPASALTQEDVLAWMDGQKWGASGRALAIAVVRGAFHWGVRRKRVAENPLEGIKKPAIPARRAVLTTEEADRVEAELEGSDFGALILVLRETGCRLSEATALEAKHLDLERGIAVLASKTTARTGRLRQIHLTERASEVLRGRALRFPEGPLFRTRTGRPWGRRTVNSRITSVRRRLGLGPGVNAGAYRHRFAIDLLTSGASAEEVAGLLGHTTTAMVFKHYGHLAEQTDFLKRALAKRTRS